jgi:hypothetical protein
VQERPQVAVPRVWEFGLRPAGPPLVRYFGERIAGAAGPASDTSP